MDSDWRESQLKADELEVSIPPDFEPALHQVALHEGEAAVMEPDISEGAKRGALVPATNQAGEGATIGPPKEISDSQGDALFFRLATIQHRREVEKARHKKRLQELDRAENGLLGWYAVALTDFVKRLIPPKRKARNNQTDSGVKISLRKQPPAMEISDERKLSHWARMGTRGEGECCKLHPSFEDFTFEDVDELLELLPVRMLDRFSYRVEVRKAKCKAWLKETGECPPGIELAMERGEKLTYEWADDKEKGAARLTDNAGSE